MMQQPDAAELQQALTAPRTTSDSMEELLDGLMGDNLDMHVGVLDFPLC